LILLVSMGGFAQTSIELVPTVGYTFANRTDYYNTYGRVADGLNFGGSVNFNVNRSFGIELMYNHMATNSGLYYYGDPSKISGTNLNFDYFMIGPVQSFNIPYSSVRPFIGFLVGAAELTPDMNSGFQSETKFAMGFQLGTNIYVSPRVGLQLKAQLLSPV